MNKTTTYAAVRPQYLNNAQGVVKALGIDVPEGICVEDIEINTMCEAPLFFEVTVKGYKTGIWHGKVEYCQTMSAENLQEKAGKYIHIIY